MEGNSPITHGKYPDGRVASAIFCAFVTSILLLVLEAYSPIQKQTDVAHVLVWVLQVSSMTIGIISASLIFCTAYRHIKTTTETERKNKTDDPSMGLKLLFLWFFAFSLILQTSFYLAIDLDCMFKGKARPFPLLLSAFSALISITFTILQVGFISYARDTDLPKSSKVVLCLLTIVIANLVIWYNSFIRDKNNLFTIGNMSQYVNESILKNETLCFWESPIQRVAEGLLPYLVPARLEYGLFASSFLLRFLPICSKSYRQHAPFREIDDPMKSNRNDSKTRRRIIRNLRPEKTMAVITSIILNFPGLILTFLIFIPKSSTLPSLYSSWIGLRMLNTLLLIVILLYGLHNLHKESCYSNLQTQISVIDVVLIFATSGHVGYFAIGFLSSLLCKCFFYGIVSTRNALIILNSFLQTIFILQGRRCYKPVSPLKWARFLCLLLSITNFYSWIESSFTNIRKHHNFELQDSLLGKNMWTYINQFLYPMVTFYRFLCCIELYRLYKILGS